MVGENKEGGFCAEQVDESVFVAFLGRGLSDEKNRSESQEA